MRMFRAWLQLEQVNDIDESDSEVREALPEQRCRSQRLLSWDVAGCGKYNVGFLGFVITGPIPDANAFCAVSNRGIDVQVLQMPLFVRDNDVDVVFRAQAMICYGQQTIGIRREVDAGYCGTLVEHYIQKPRILVRKTIVILTPHSRSNKKIQRCDLAAPR